MHAGKRRGTKIKSHTKTKKHAGGTKRREAKEAHERDIAQVLNIQIVFEHYRQSSGNNSSEIPERINGGFGGNTGSSYVCTTDQQVKKSLRKFTQPSGTATTVDID